MVSKLVVTVISLMIYLSTEQFVNGAFTNWTDYMGCDVCNNVTMEYRNRTCLLPVCVSDVDGTNYTENQIEVQSRNCTDICAKLVNQTEPCSESCTGGMQKVTFICTGTVGTCPLSVTGFPLADLNPGSSFSTDLPCNDDIPCGPEWTPWELIAGCNGTCLDFGYKLESRQCLHPNCTNNVTYFAMGENETRSIPCNLSDYGCRDLGPWSNWTECTEDIVCNGDGKQSRYRLCGHDICLENGTLYLRGSNQTEFRDCNFTCASLVEMNSTQCSVSCGGPGYRNATYRCRGDVGTCSYAGKVCYPGDKIHVINEVCNLNVSCPIIWTNWTDWSNCSVDCGGMGNRTRTRTCLNETCYSDRAASMGMVFRMNDTETADEECDFSHIACGDNFEEWSMWSTCSGTCGVGTRKRSRACQAGFECLGQCDQVEKCTTPCRLPTCSLYPPCPADCNFETDCFLKWRYYNAEERIAWTLLGPSSSVQPNVEPTFNKEGCGRFVKLVEKSSKINYAWTDLVVAEQTHQCIGFSLAVFGTNTDAITDFQAYIYYVKRPNAELIYSKYGNTNLRWEEIRRPVQVITNESFVILFQVNETTTGVTYGDVGLDNFQVTNGDCLKLGWSHWTAWSCNVTCGNGTETRTRKCLDAPSMTCAGVAEQQRDCQKPECPTPAGGVWGQWGVFSACSETCGNGVRTRQRKCDSPAPKYGGSWCEHTTYNNFDLPIESEYEVDCVPCNVKSCSNFFTPWGSWSTCSGSCGVGMRKRTRQCETGKKCIGPCEQIEKCYAGCRNDECPNYQATMECNFEDLTSPGCKVSQHSENGGVSWAINQAMPMDTPNSGPSIDSTFMTGCGHYLRFSSDFATTSYVWTPIIDPTNDTYCLRFKYSMVSNMNESMGNLSVHKYLLVKNPRFALQPLFEHMGVTDNLWNAAKVNVPTYSAERFVIVFKVEHNAGGDFSDIGIDDIKVMDMSCNENYTRWSPYSACNATCGNGTKSRFRVCIDDDPTVCTYNQKYFDYAECNEGDCPDLSVVHGNWSNWAEYTDCNATCDGGFRIRSRNCSNPMPANGGDLCVLSNSEIPVRSDYEEECVPCNEFPCNGTGFTNFTTTNETCSTAGCSNGTVIMERTCLNSTNCTGLTNNTIANGEKEFVERLCSITENQMMGGCIPDDNWVLIDQNFTGCLNDCENGTFTETYSCNAGMGGSCQGMNGFLPRASNGTIEEVERTGICSQQLVCQNGTFTELLNIAETTCYANEFRVDNCSSGEVGEQRQCQNGSCVGLDGRKYLPNEYEVVYRNCTVVDFCPYPPPGVYTPVPGSSTEGASCLNNCAATYSETFQCLDIAAGSCVDLSNPRENVTLGAQTTLSNIPCRFTTAVTTGCPP